jgi:hypothetical protein
MSNWLVFSLGGEWYGLPAGAVTATGAYGDRGVPVFDLGARRPGDPDPAHVIAVGGAGVAADEIAGELEVSAERRLPVQGSETVKAIAMDGDRLIVLLDPAGLLVTGAR